jgi:sec-independent protein translocase protein TatA
MLSVMITTLSHPSILGFGLPGGSEWFWIFLAVVILFGAKKIPDLARGLGKSMGEFKRAKEEFDRELTSAAKDTKPVPPNNSISNHSSTDSTKNS